MLVVVAYDVKTETKAGARRLRRVAKLCQDHGQRVGRQPGHHAGHRVVVIGGQGQDLVDRAVVGVQRCPHATRQRPYGLGQVGRLQSIEAIGHTVSL